MKLKLNLKIYCSFFFLRNIWDAKYLQKYTVNLAQSLRENGVSVTSRAVSHEENARPRSRGMEERDWMVSQNQTATLSNGSIWLVINYLINN